LHPTVYAEFSPTCANEFPNDNPVLHQGARWVCREPLGAARALLLGPTEAGAAPLNEAAGVAASGSASTRPAQLEPAAEQPASQLAGPLELDLARIVLPHRVENVPPPPDFIFRPLASSRRPAAPAPLFEPVTVPLRALPLLGYRVVDEHVVSSRVERRWRVDVAPCVAVAAALPLALRETEVVLQPAVARAVEPEAVEAVELESLAQALFPVLVDPPGVSQLELLAPVAPGGTEPPGLLPSEPAAAQASDSEAPASQKRQRRRATRVASSASLATAALAANAELTHALSEIASAFSERRAEQPRAERKRRGRKPAGKAASKSAGKKAAAETARRRAANAV
jgi:hypothetical protein